MTNFHHNPLTPIESRIARGLQHVDELEEHVEKYRRGGRDAPYRIEHIPDGDDWFVGKVHLTRDPQPYLGVVAGERDVWIGTRAFRRMGEATINLLRGPQDDASVRAVDRDRVTLARMQ